MSNKSGFQLLPHHILEECRKAWNSSPKLSSVEFRNLLGIYADFLEESGLTARAELIQVCLSQGGGADGFVRRSVRQLELEKHFGMTDIHSAIGPTEKRHRFGLLRMLTMTHHRFLRKQGIPMEHYRHEILLEELRLDANYLNVVFDDTGPNTFLSKVPLNQIRRLDVNCDKGFTNHMLNAWNDQLTGYVSSAITPLDWAKVHMPGDELSALARKGQMHLLPRAKILYLTCSPQYVSLQDFDWGDERIQADTIFLLSPEVPGGSVCPRKDGKAVNW